MKSIGASYGENPYEKYDKKTENVAGISANNDLTINANNNVNLKGATLDGKNSLNLNSNSLIIEDLKDVSYSNSSNLNLGYNISFSFGGGSTQPKSEIGIMKILNTSIDGLENVNKYTKYLGVSVDASRISTTNIDSIKGGISNTDNIHTNNLVINNDYNQNVSDIFTDTQNNRVNIYNETTGYNYHVAPSTWISNPLSALNAMKEYANFANDSKILGITVLPFNLDNFIITDTEFGELLIANQKLNQKLEDTIEDYNLDLSGLEMEAKGKELNKDGLLEIPSIEEHSKDFLFYYENESVSNKILSEYEYTKYVNYDEERLWELETSEVGVNDELKQNYDIINGFASDMKNEGVIESKIPTSLDQLANGDYVVWGYENFRTAPGEECLHHCGYFGANRYREEGKGLHYGEDILSTEGMLVLSPVSGTITDINVPYTSKATGDFRKLHRVAIYAPEYSVSSVIFYLSSDEYTNLTKGNGNLYKEKDPRYIAPSEVEVGDILGIAQDIHKYGYSERTENHIHNQVNYNYGDYKSPDPKKVFDYNNIQRQIENRYSPLKQAYKNINNIHINWGI